MKDTDTITLTFKQLKRIIVESANVMGGNAMKNNKLWEEFLKWNQSSQDIAIQNLLQYIDSKALGEAMIAQLSDGSSVKAVSNINNILNS